MRTKPSFIAIIFFLVAKTSLSQSHYIIEYDRLSQDVSFHKVLFNHGEKSEVSIKKPLLERGDIIEARMTNVNEFVFDTDINLSKIKTLSKENNGFIQNAMSGLGLLGFDAGIFGAISKITSITENQEIISINSRGGANLSQEKMQQLKIEQSLSEDIQSLNYGLNLFKNVNNEFEILNGLIHSETLNLNDFKTEAIEQIKKIKSVDLANTIKRVKADIAHIKETLEQINSVKDQDLLNKELIDNSQKILDFSKSLNITSIQNELSDSNLENIQEKLVAADFMYQTKFIVDDWKEKEFDNEKTRVEETAYDIDFLIYRKQNSSSDKTQSLVSHRIVRINSVSPLKPTWTTGFTYHFPFSKNHTVISEEDYVGDSITFKKGNEIKSGLAIATQLMFEFGNFEKIIPNVSIGVSYSINEFINQESSWGESESLSSNLNILLGTGIRSRGFRYFSLNTGISWNQSNTLISNLTLGKTYDIQELEDSGINQDEYLENKWKPSFFLGVGFHF
ncbi:hypothetical protein N9M15_03890 [Bacteroidia bacterium]|nr:hypothetical protein [Bacteroidia bacterium]